MHLLCLLCYATRMHKAKHQLGGLYLPFPSALYNPRGSNLTCFCLTLGAGIGVDTKALLPFLPFP
jgi:hypothetical protein